MMVMILLDLSPTRKSMAKEYDDDGDDDCEPVFMMIDDVDDDDNEICLTGSGDSCAK